MEALEGLCLVRSGPKCCDSILRIDSTQRCLQGVTAAPNDGTEIPWISRSGLMHSVPPPISAVSAGTQLRKPVWMKVELDVVSSPDGIPPLVLHPVSDRGAMPT